MTDNEITLLAKSYEGVQSDIEASVLGQQELSAAHDLCAHLGELRQTGDFEAMLEAEESLIARDTEKAILREPHITDEMQRMERATMQVTKALKCHEQLTKDTESYKNSAEYFSTLDRNGYPKDSCREFLGSQGTRVKDRLRQPHNDAEASIFKARSANIEAMKRLYPALQASLIETRERGVESIRAAQAESKKILSNQKAQEAGQERKPEKGRSKDEDRGR